MIDNFSTAFANRLRYFMEKYNMTQRDLSVKMGVSEASVSNWIKGIKVPRADKIDKLCLLFKCKRTDLIDSPINGVYMYEDPIYFEVKDPSTEKIQQLLEKATEEQKRKFLKIAKALLDEDD